MAHRKQIRVSKASKQAPVTNVNFSFIVNDMSKGKSMSNHILKGMILKDMKFLHKFKKTELVVLCKAYNVQSKSTENKDNLVKKLKLLNQEMKFLTNNILSQHLVMLHVANKH